MDIKNIRTFIRVAELMNFTKAAQELGYAQSTVTSQIQQLEDELTTSLFDRNGKIITLSHAGKDFLAYAYQIIRYETEAIEYFTLSGELKGELTIGVMETIVASDYSTLFQDFISLHPQVSLKLKIVTTHEALDYIHRGKLDFIFLLDEKTYQPDMITALELPVDIVFFCAKDAPILKKEEVQLEDILTEPFILTERSCNYRNTFETYLSRHQKSLSCITEIGYTPYILEAVRRNKGIGLLPTISLQNAIEQDEISILPLQDYQITMYIQVIYNKNKPFSRLMEAFLRYVKDNNRGSM